MSTRRLAVFVLMVAVFAGAAFAQGKRKQPYTTIAVAKNLAEYEDAQVTTIQEAVNIAALRPGSIIEILDTEVYEEQVTIDGRSPSPWAGVTGGAEAITILYVPPAGSTPNGNYARPTIRHRDTRNTSPRSAAEASVEGDQVGSAGNFEMCGALRITHARNITIDGIAVDGGGGFAFGASGVWLNPRTNQYTDLSHGNAAITIVVSEGTVVRNAVAKNAYFGINVKDRNTGGVFANPNPADLDLTVPLSGFGFTGNHLIEYNRVHDNAVAFFFESAWDLGSNIRYNLIFDNYFKPAVATQVTVERSNNNAGAFLFKDLSLTPLAIYNNTLYNNTANFLGHWQIGGQHLIFNNIFSKSDPGSLGGTGNPGSSYMVIDNRFPNRMHNSVFSANVAVQMQCQADLNCERNSVNAPGGCYVDNVRLQNFQSPQRGPGSLYDCNNPSNNPRSQDMTRPGALLQRGEGDGVPRIPSSANVRWLQTEGWRDGSSRLDTLFKSLNPTSPDFLVPKWDHPLVEEFIKNKGWVNAGVRNSDGLVADLGAIPSNGARQATIGRLKPTNVVLVTGRNAVASVFLTVESGTINNPAIRFLRWVSPVPLNNCDDSRPCTPKNGWANNFVMIDSASVQPIPATNALVPGNNNFSFELPRSLGEANMYGFFEMIVEGTDANGNRVTTDVGFLPYRQLEYTLLLEVVHPTNNNVILDTVIAGEPYRLRVTPRGANNITYTGTLENLGFTLTSDDPTAQMYCNGGSRCTQDQPLLEDTNVPGQVIYPVYFTRAGNTVIRGNGLDEISQTNRLVFIGITEVEVIPGAPAQVTFESPVSKSILGTTLPEVINRGVERDVTVRVEDRFGNAVRGAHRVEISSANSDATPANFQIGTAGAPGNLTQNWVNTDPATGVATFSAQANAGAAVGMIFDMTASITLPGGGTNTDVGSLRVGRTLDALQVLYGDAAHGVYEPDSVIDGMVGQWFLVTVRATIGDSVITSRNQHILVEGTDGLIMASTPDGAPGMVFPMTNGVATFWVGASSSIQADIANGCVNVTALRTSDPADVDGSIGRGSRCDIRFVRPTSSIRYAVVYGNGHGVPDSVVLYYAAGQGNGFYTPELFPLPTSVELTWPTTASLGATALAANITVVDTFVLSVKFPNPPFISGYTSIDGDGRGLVTVTGGVAGPTSVEDAFDVIDGIGPIIADDVADQRPTLPRPGIIENPNRGTVPDTLVIWLTEGVFDEVELEGVRSIFYTQADPGTGPATGGEALNVSRAILAQNGSIKLVLDAGSYVPAAGDWIRLNPASSVLDNASSSRHDNHPANGPHANNRWVQVREIEVPATILDGYYTSDNRTGLVNYAYITFNKAVNLSTWFASFAFGPGADAGANPATFTTISPTDPNTVVIDLAVAFPSSQNAIRTSGGMDVTVNFVDWDPDVRILTDRAKPVLATDMAELRRGVLKDDGSYAPDTLVVTYSEPMPQSLCSIERPLAIKTDRFTHDPLLSSCAATTAGNYTRVTYLIETPVGAERMSVSTGDSVFIMHGAGVADGVSTGPNVQDDPDNRRVVLRVQHNMSWRFAVENNPFRSGGEATIRLNPGSEEQLKIEATVRIFDRLGNLVYSPPIDPITTRDGFSWSWNGRNANGRVVGTGSYLFVTTIDYWVTNENGVVDETSKSRYRERRLVGFVR